VDQSLPFLLNPAAIAGIVQFVLNYSYLNRFVTHSRSKLKVVRNRAKYWCFCFLKFSVCRSHEN